MTHDLSWITFSKLVEIAKKSFRSSFMKVHEDDFNALSTEPTLVLVRATLAGGIVKNQADADRIVAVTKTIQNAVGNFHQEVLGSVDGWETLGKAGGVLDIKSTEPVSLAGHRTVIAEVKMRYNTIKASDEKSMHDKIKDAVNLYGGSKQAVGYIFQIVPQNKAGYDRPWVVSGREQVDYVRAADGVTAYHLVTGIDAAYFQLMDVLPEVIREAAEELRAAVPPKTKSMGAIDLGQPPVEDPTADAGSLFTSEEVRNLIRASMPDSSNLSNG